MTGKDLEYVEYEQLLDFVKPDKKAFFITCADYVTTEDGTGIVHTAPAFGEDDYNCGKNMVYQYFSQLMKEENLLQLHGKVNS